MYIYVHMQFNESPYMCIRTYADLRIHINVYIFECEDMHIYVHVQIYESPGRATLTAEDTSYNSTC